MKRQQIKKYSWLIVLLLIFFIVIGFFLTGSMNNQHFFKTTYKTLPNNSLIEETKLGFIKNYTLKENHLSEGWELETSIPTSNPKIDSIELAKNQYLYKNHYLGYQLFFPEQWKLDNHQSDIFVRFYNKEFHTQLSYQDLTQAWSNWDSFYELTVKPLENHIHNEEFWENDAFEFKLIEYKRKKINSLDNDMNYYAYLFLVKDKHVFTFHLKANETSYPHYLNELKKVASSLNQTNRDIINLQELTHNRNHKVEFIHDNKSLLIPQNKFIMGTFTKKSSDIYKIEKDMDITFGSQMIYKGVNSKYDNYVKKLTKKNKVPVITFLFEDTSKKDNSTIVQEIIDGDYDDNFIHWSKGIKNAKSPVLIRLGNEMNGNWADWSHKNNFNDPDLYKTAYRRIVDIFKHNEVSNAYFVWNPNSRSAPFFNWNHSSVYYPGQEYVDFVGMTAYNFGKTKWGEFKHFEELYSSLYNEYLRMYPNKPFIIGEFGSVENGGNKAEFIEHFFRVVPHDYPNIKLAIWFDAVHEPYDFRISTNEESKNAFIKGMNHSEIVDGLE